MTEEIDRLFEQSMLTIRQTQQRLGSRMAWAADLVLECLRNGGGLLLFGNGGSASDAQHIAAELVGRFMLDRRPFKAVALNVNSSVVTAIANDYDYRQVFARQLAALGSAGDVAVALSTSGNSPNVVEGLKEARRMGMKTIALTGSGGGQCAELADVLLDVPSNVSPRIQESHAVIYHILCQLVEKALADQGHSKGSR